jgi:hypothetical protein
MNDYYYGLWTEPKGTCCQYENQPNVYNMYTDFGGNPVCLFISSRQFLFWGGKFL